jgi:5-formyltetrahydrofolate cyclo-ligase
MNIAEQKSALRIGIKERLLTMSAKDRDIESRVLSKELERMLGNTPKTIAGYMALSDEPAITPVPNT